MQQQAQGGWETLSIFNEKSSGVLRDPYPENGPQPNFWRRLLGRAS
jgi:hypothetical protein